MTRESLRIRRVSDQRDLLEARRATILPSTIVSTDRICLICTSGTVK